jgi:hypothetical protein
LRCQHEQVGEIVPKRCGPDRLPKQTATRQTKDESEFAGKVALVTGGTSGIGVIAARPLAALGALGILLPQSRVSPAESPRYCKLSEEHCYFMMRLRAEKVLTALRQ